MSESTQALTRLYPIEECPDLYVDACICDEQRNLVFLSCWGRDTALQEFLARLQLGSAEKGLNPFHTTLNGHRLPVFLDIDRLEKRTTRQYRGTLFGSLLHLWLFDQRCAQPDRANHIAYALIQNGTDPSKRLWPLIMDTCPLPLLPHWGPPVMALLTEHEMLYSLPGAQGAVTAWRLALRIELLENLVGEHIRQGTLTTEAPVCT